MRAMWLPPWRVDEPGSHNHLTQAMWPSSDHGPVPEVLTDLLAKVVSTY